MDIREATSASNNPRDGSNDLSSGNDWATRVSHAHSLASLRERADGVVKHERGVVRGMTATALGQGHGASVQEHQVSRSGAGVLK